MSDKQPRELVPLTSPTTRSWKTDPPPSSSDTSQHPPETQRRRGSGCRGSRGAPASGAQPRCRPGPPAAPLPRGLQPLPGPAGHGRGQLQGQLQPSPRGPTRGSGQALPSKAAGEACTYTRVSAQLRDSRTAEKGSARASCRHCSTAEAGGQQGLPCEPPNPQEPRARPLPQLLWEVKHAEPAPCGLGEGHLATTASRSLHG